MELAHGGCTLGNAEWALVPIGVCFSFCYHLHAFCSVWVAASGQLLSGIYSQKATVIVDYAL